MSHLCLTFNIGRGKILALESSIFGASQLASYVINRMLNEHGYQSPCPPCFGSSDMHSSSQRKLYDASGALQPSFPGFVKESNVRGLRMIWFVVSNQVAARNSCFSGACISSGCGCAKSGLCNEVLWGR